MSVSTPALPRTIVALAAASLACSCSGGADGGPRTSVQFDTSSSSVSEGGVSSVRIRLSAADGPLEEDVLATVVDLGAGTASGGLDFAPIPEQTFSFPAGTEDGAVLQTSIQTLPDSCVEGAPETIRLGLAVSGAARGDRKHHTLAIADDDRATVAFQDSASATLGEATASHPVAVVVTLPPGTTLEAGLTVRVADAKTGSATRGADYAAFGPKTVTLPEGTLSGTIFPVLVPILGDSEPEGAETIVLSLVSPSAGLDLGATIAHTLTITDDDLGPAAEVRVVEDPGPGATVLASGASVSLGTQVLLGGATGGRLVRIESQGAGPLAFELPWIDGGAERDFAIEFEPEGLGGSALASAAETPSPLVADAAGNGATLDPGLFAAANGLARARWTGFPLLGEIVELDLARRAAPWSPDAHVVVDGVVTTPSDWLGDASVWSGAVSGEEGSSVFLALSSAGSHGWIRRRGATVHVVPDPEQPLRVLELADLDLEALGAREPGDFCRVPPQPSGFGAPRGALPAHGLGGSGPLPVCRIAIETDFQLLNRLGDPGTLATYVHALVAAAAERYQVDVGVELSMSYLGVHTSPDDGWTTPDVLGTPGEMLDEFQHRWGAAWGGTWPAPANLAHFLSGANLGGGVAYIGALCDQNWGFAVSANINGMIPWSNWNGAAGPLNWDFVVFTHELGHNFGSLHTHAYCPPVDRCYASCAGGSHCQQGTLMSYCHLCAGIGAVDLRFHPFTANEMRSQVRTSCLGEVLLLPGESLDLRVRFDPVTALGPRSTTVEFDHNAGNAPSPFEIVLTGTAIP